MIKITTHSKRKLIYNLVDIIGILSFFSVFVLAIGQKTKSEFIKNNIILFLFLFIIGFIWSLLRLFVGRMEWYQPIDRTGEIDFYDDYLVFRKINIQIDQIKTIRIGVTQCKGYPMGGRSGLSDGTGNYIEIFLKDKTRLKERLLIENIEQTKELKSLMDTWKKTGIMIIGYWKPMLTIFDK